MKFRGKQYNDYDIEELISDAWDDAVVGESRAVYMVGYLSEVCYDDVSEYLKDTLYELLCKREGVDASPGGKYEVMLNPKETQAILRFIVHKVLDSIVYCNYTSPKYMLGLVGEWIAKETMNG